MSEIDIGVDVMVLVLVIVGVNVNVGLFVVVGASHDAEAGRNMLNRHEITPAADSTARRKSPKRWRAIKGFRTPVVQITKTGYSLPQPTAPETRIFTAISITASRYRTMDV
jgi:hypothetical protein